MRAPEEILIERLMNVFGEPKADAPDAYLVEFANAVRGWSASILERAGSEVIRTSKFFPRPAEVNEIASKIAEDDAAKARAARQPLRDDPRPPRTPEECERAAALVKRLRETVAKMAINQPRATQTVDWTKAQRPGFERVQNDSRNIGMHRTLTPRSRAMMGDGDHD